MIYRQRATEVIMYGSEQVAEVLIEQTSTRKFLLMKEDFIRLDFTLDRAIPFRIGCHIDDELFGRFIIRKEQMPQYQENTGGYKYQLQFDAEYMHMEDSKYMLMLEKESQTEKDVLIPVRDSVEFSLTADLFGQIESWINSAETLGYHIEFDKNTDTNFSEDIAPYKVELMKFSSIGMLSAIYDICNKWGIECWFETTEIGFRLKLGKCELGEEPLILEQGVNVANMKINDGRKTFANRIYVYGGKDNIAYDYRRKVQNNVVKWYDANFPGTSKPHFSVFALENNTKAFKNAMVTANFFVEEDGVIDNNSWPKTTNTEYDMQWLNIKTTSMSFRSYWTEAIQQTDPYLDYEVVVTYILKRKENNVLHPIGTKVLTYTGRARRSQSYHLYFMESGNVYTDFDYEAGTVPSWEVLHLTKTNSKSESYGFDFTDDPRTLFSEDYSVKRGSIYLDVSWQLKLKSNGTQVYSTHSDSQYNSRDRYYVNARIRYHFHHTVGDWAMFKTIDDTGAERKVRTVYIKYYADVNAITSDSVHAVLTDGSSTDNDGKGLYVMATSPIVEWNGTSYDDDTLSVSELVNILFKSYSGTNSGDVTEPRRFAFDSDDPDIPSALFTTPYDDPSSVLRVGEQRLRMPQDFGDFVETEESASDPSKRIEACVVFDKISPKLRLYVKEALSVAETEEQQYEAEDESAYWMYHQFFVKLAFIGGDDITNENFSKKSILDGETLKLKFVTPRDFDLPENDYQGKLSGMEFDLEWMPNGTYYGDGAGGSVCWGEMGCFKIIRNDTFGAKLPNDDLKVTQGDYCTLLGINLRKFRKTSMYTTAEEELKAKGLAYLNALQEGNFTFDCTMLTDFMRRVAINEQEELASQNELAFTLPSPTSGNTDRLYAGRKVRILNDALPTKMLIPKTTAQLTEDDFEEFLFGMFISKRKVMVLAGERVELEMLGAADTIFLWDNSGEGKSVVAGEGTLVYENTTYNDVELYVGLGRVQKFLASVLEDYPIDGWGTQWSAPEPVVINPGRTITIQSTVPTALIYYKEVEGEWEEFIVGGTENSTQWTNNEGEPIEVWAGTKNTPADLWLYVDSVAQGVRVMHSRYVGTKDSRVIGYELKLDCPEDGARYTIGETEAYSRLDKLEKEISKS